MPQCAKYPNKCRGQVRLDRDDNNWYCEKHFSEYDRVKTKFKMVKGKKVYLKRTKKDKKKDKEKEKEKKP